LIRSMQKLGSTRLIEGSSTCMDYLLGCTKKYSVAALAGSFDGSIDPPHAPIFLSLEDPIPLASAQPIYTSARVGLTLKKGATPERKRFLARPYRFLIEPARIKKGRPQLIASMYLEGKRASEIEQITKAGPAVVKRYLEALEEGRGRSPEDFDKHLSGPAICGLIGSLAARGYRADSTQVP